VFNFTVTADQNNSLIDLAPGVAGLQTRVVIDLPIGVRANVYTKFNANSGQWNVFMDDQRLETFDDGATLIDANNDGFVERIVVTLTDGGPGDEDGLVNGIIVDPGLLAFQDKTKPVFSVLLASGDRYYSTSAADTARMALGTANKFEGVRFDALDAKDGGQQVNTHKNFITGDWYFAASGQPMPYLCYVQQSDSGFTAAAAGNGPGTNFHRYMDKNGITQLVTQIEATQLGLTGKGYKDFGAIFNTTTTTAFTFDPEAYLVANRNNEDIQNLVDTLSGKYQKTSDAGFIEAVESHYLNQITLVGLPHGEQAGASDLNAAFGTAFLV
jgi:hypothetical protein